MLAAASHVYAEGGLSTLSKIAKSQEDMAETVNKETTAFRAVKNALETGKLKKGQSQGLISAQYGDPVITLTEEGNIEKWIYKPANSSYFSGIKIYLFFDHNKLLMGIKMLNS